MGPCKHGRDALQYCLSCELEDYENTIDQLRTDLAAANSLLSEAEAGAVHVNDELRDLRATIEGQGAAIAPVTAERARYREALEKIAERTGGFCMGSWESQLCFVATAALTPQGAAKP